MPRRLRSRRDRSSPFLVENLEARRLLSGVAAATAAGYIWPNTQTISIRSNSSIAAKTSVATSSTPQASGATTVTSAASTVTYNRAAAVAYANANWNLVVSDGYFWINGSTAKYYGAGQPVPVNQPNEASGIGDDCAHFVSSCIGTPGGGLTIPSRAGTYGEPGAARLDELLVGNSLGGYGTTYQYGTLVSSVSQLTPGDVIGYDWDGSGGGSMSGIDHTTIYVGNNQVDAHATSHLAANYTLGGAKYYFFVHITLPDTNVPSTPTNSSPANNATGVSTTPKLTANAFSDAAPGSTEAAAQWQVYKGSTLVYDSGTDTTDLISCTVPTGKLASGTAYTWKVRYEDSYGGWGNYSTATSFTVGSATPPNTPINNTPLNNASISTTTPKLIASAFSDPSGGTQTAAEWQIHNGATLVYDSGVDATDLTTLTVPSGILTTNSTYTWNVRYKDSFGNWSGYSTATSFTIPPPANQPPTMGSLTAAPNPHSLPQGYHITLTPGQLSDPDGTVASVQYYMESNGVSGLQTGAGGDTLLATANSATNFVGTLDTSDWAVGSVRLFAIAVDDQGATSAYQTVTFTINAPLASVTATATGGRTAHLTWSGAPATLDGFIIERSTDGQNFTQVGTAPAAATGFDDSGLTPGAGYTYRVKITSGQDVSTPTVAAPISTWRMGDTNGDGKVDLTDYNTLAANFNQAGGWAQGDFDGDGTVTLSDYNLLVANFTS